MQSTVKQLSTVTVSASRPALEMGIDRKFFNVDKSLTAAGGTAIDIMKNIPSVSVDIDGNVELRNSTPQIFVDGRPTILTLDQIPADHIERIELITNPSAKFDASSSGGIINIVLKKNKRVGLNGLASVSGGIPELFSGNLNLNLRQGKFNLFASGGYNQSGGKGKGQTLRQNKDNGVITDYFNQYTVNERSRKFSSIRFGADYFIDNRNTVTLSQNFVRGRFGNDESQYQEYLNSNKIMQYFGQRMSDEKSSFNRRSTRLNYKHNFPKEGKEFTADVNYNYGDRAQYSSILNDFFYPDGTEYSPSSVVTNEGKSNETQFTFQADFTDPITENRKIETGIRTFRNTFTSYYDAFAHDNGQPEKLPLSNNYEYTETIHAAYFTFSDKKETFSYQLGLRAEYSRFDGLLVDSAFKFGYEYPDKFSKLWNALFPSFFLSKKIGEDNELQFNYTRRIRRPRFWQLNPFIDINDPVNLRQGNPGLKPEFINSFELNYSKNYKSGNFLAVLYFRNNPDDITQYSDTITAAQYQQLSNAAVDPNAILNTFINAGTTNRYGAEFTLQHKVGKNFDITPSFNLQYRTTKANVNNLNLSNQGFNWEGKLIVNYKIETVDKSIFKNLGFQLTGEYESPRVIPQGRRTAEFDVDMALRKDFLKDKKASVTFAINDLFNTRKWGTIYDTEQFYQDSYRRWRVRSFRLTFSYKFGDANFTLGRRNGGNGGGDDD
jgi:outer membrane receptor protein involved in Fe transport